MRPRLQPVKGLALDRTLYPRRAIDHKLVETYADAMRSGAKLPPAVIATVDGKLVVLDGWHRINAAKKNGQANVQVVDRGTLGRTEAFAEAVRLNAVNGKPLDYRERLAAYERLVEEGVPVKRVSEEIVFISKERMRMYAGKMTGPSASGGTLRPMAPVLTVTGDRGFAGSVSLSGDAELPSAASVSILEYVGQLVSEERIDWGDRKLVAALRRLRDLLVGLKFPKEN